MREFTPRCGLFRAAALRPTGRSPAPSATRGSRAVGYALHVNPEPGVIPCHRVVRRDGAVSPAFAFGGSNRQVELLQNEGVEFTDESHVDMARFCVRALPYIAE